MTLLHEAEEGRGGPSPPLQSLPSWVGRSFQLSWPSSIVLSNVRIVDSRHLDIGQGEWAFR